jgi:hypothetical protein
MKQDKGRKFSLSSSIHRLFIFPIIVDILYYISTSVLQILFCALVLPPNLGLDVGLTSSTRKSSVITEHRQRRKHGPKTGRRVI